VLDDATVPVQQRVMIAERHRLGLGGETRPGGENHPDSSA
jgi:hypothetical protein